MTLPHVPSEALAQAYEIGEVARLTGLSPTRLRAWERRYELVRPRRQPNGYRAYSADQVALLRVFGRLVSEGGRIGDLAGRTPDELARLIEERATGSGSPLSALLRAIQALDREGLEHLVAQLLALHGLEGLGRQIVLPLAVEVGDLWALGRLPVASEHLVSEVIVHTLKSGLRVARQAGPRVVGAGLPGERHEWGFLCALAEIQGRGWNVEYLGPDLPLDDVAETAWRLRPDRIALTGCLVDTVARALPGLARLASRLPPGQVVVLGGCGTEPHRPALERMGLRWGMEAFPPAHILRPSGAV